jgi:hypothetical protein
MSKPTHEDAQIMLQLVQAWPTDATDWIWSDDFIPDHDEFMQKYPGAGEELSSIRAILNWYETIGTLFKHGLLNEDLLFDWLAIYAVWDRVKSHALAWRAETGEPRMYENFEAMANAQVAWAERSRREAA